jgi:hypothetical protein
MRVRDVFTLSDGRTVFAGEIADGPDYVSESDCDLVIDGRKAAGFRIEGEMFPLRKRAVHLRAISTTWKLDLDLVRSSLATGTMVVEIVGQGPAQGLG